MAGVRFWRNGFGEVGHNLHFISFHLHRYRSCFKHDFDRFQLISIVESNRRYNIHAGSHSDQGHHNSDESSLNRSFESCSTSALTFIEVTQQRSMAEPFHEITLLDTFTASLFSSIFDVS